MPSVMGRTKNKLTPETEIDALVCQNVCCCEVHVTCRSQQRLEIGLGRAYMLTLLHTAN